LKAGELETVAEGVLLTDAQREAASAYLSRQATPMSKRDRISYIICAAICAGQQPLRLKALQEKFAVSRNLVFADLNDVKKELEAYQLKLKNSREAGYFVQGDLLLMRTVFQLHISSLLRTVNWEQLDLFSREHIADYLDKMKRLTSDLSLRVGEDSLLELVYLLLMIRARPSQNAVQMVDAELIEKTRELQAVNTIFADLQPHERNYLAICLMNFSNGSTYAGMWTEELELWECAKRLIDLFEITACVSFEKKEELLHAIYMHMKLSCYNYRNTVPHINRLREEIAQNYPELFSMTKSCCTRMMPDFPYPVGDDEIAYLTMHFGVAMHNASHKAEVAHVLLTCPSITTSAQLLRAEVETKFDNIIVEDVVRVGEINAYPADRPIDFVISTVSFDCRYPVIRVHPILTDEDVANIATLMTLLDIDSSLGSFQLKVLLRIVRRNVDDTTYVRIREELNHYLNAEGTLMHIPENTPADLYHTLQNCGIRFVDGPADDWEQEVRMTAAPLHDSGSIEPRYIQTMLELGRTHGPYFVISDDIAIAHARPKDGAKRLGLTLSIYRQGLTILGRTGIRFLFVLSSPDQQKHLHILENILALSHDAAARQALCAAEDAEQAFSILERFQ
ncbi:MAG: PRD domain-containing protein, partial [Butyricicoccus sp.]|nr:PRD domain-containing protein [Butyricicoccus sp.]